MWVYDIGVQVAIYNVYRYNINMYNTYIHTHQSIVYQDITCISDGKVEYIGHTVSSLILLPRPLVRCCRISTAVSISSWPKNGRWKVDGWIGGIYVYEYDVYIRYVQGIVYIWWEYKVWISIYCIYAYMSYRKQYTQTYTRVNTCIPVKKTKMSPGTGCVTCICNIVTITASTYTYNNKYLYIIVYLIVLVCIYQCIY